MSEENNNPLFGKPWENAFVYKTFKGADNKRNTILSEGTCQVKVKRRSDGQFIVKTRPLVVVNAATKTKKAKKGAK